MKTLERLKGDMLLEYVPPMNLLQVFWVIALEFYVVEKDFRALLIIGPAQLVLKPRALHKLHVFLVRLTSFPMLVSHPSVSGEIAQLNRQSAYTGCDQPCKAPRWHHTFKQCWM